MLNKDFQIGIILLIGCSKIIYSTINHHHVLYLVMTFLGSFSLLSPGILMLCKSFFIPSDKSHLF
jgi:hypothetical protein